MSMEKQDLTNILFSVNNDIERFSSELANYVDNYLDKISESLKQTVSSSSWLPEGVKPRKPIVSHKPARKILRLSLSERVSGWITNHKVLTGAIIVIISGISYYFSRGKISQKKRKAIRARDGSRLEIVVVAGQPGEPYTRSVSLDLERRGYIVFIICSTNDEERIVQNELRPDIRPLALDIRNPISAKASIQRFTTYLQSPHTAFPGAKSHYYTLRSLIVIATTRYPTIPIAKLDLSILSDISNTSLLQPIIIIQNFLPLFQSLPLVHSNTYRSIFSNSKPSILMLTPSIITSINPAFHLPEASITSALASFTSVLEQELAPLSIPVIHLKLGNFDLSGFSSYQKQLTIQSQRAETLSWDENTRNNYGQNYTISTTGKWGKQSNLRVLNKAIFDAMYSKSNTVIRVGSGSTIYEYVGKWVPRSIISWMMGLSKVKRLDIREGLHVSTVGSESNFSNTAKLVESKYPYGQRDDETFEDAGVWT